MTQRAPPACACRCTCSPPPTATCASNQAREVLETVARQVQPILRRRKFTVPLLKEFYPRNPGLLVSAVAAPARLAFVQGLPVCLPVAMKRRPLYWAPPLHACLAGH